MRNVRSIVIHHPVHNPLDHTSAAEITRTHRLLGAAFLGYHYVIERNGDMVLGRPLGASAGRTVGQDSDTVDVCLCPKAGLDASTAQLAQLKSLIYGLLVMFPDAHTTTASVEVKTWLKENDLAR